MASEFDDPDPGRTPPIGAALTGLVLALAAGAFYLDGEHRLAIFTLGLLTALTLAAMLGRGGSP